MLPEIPRNKTYISNKRKCDIHVKIFNIIELGKRKRKKDEKRKNRNIPLNISER